jgi:hypothetical protein
LWKNYYISAPTIGAWSQRRWEEIFASTKLVAAHNNNGRKKSMRVIVAVILGVAAVAVFIAATALSVASKKQNYIYVYTD